MFFLHEMREAKSHEFINLHQGDISVKKYAMKFRQLSKCVPTIVIDPSAMMDKIMSGDSDLVAKECLTTMLVKDMDFSCLMVHAEKIEQEKLKGKTRDWAQKG